MPRRRSGDVALHIALLGVEDGGVEAIGHDPAPVSVYTVVHPQIRYFLSRGAQDRPRACTEIPALHGKDEPVTRQEMAGPRRCLPTGHGRSRAAVQVRTMDALHPKNIPRRALGTEREGDVGLKRVEGVLRSATERNGGRNDPRRSDSQEPCRVDIGLFHGEPHERRVMARTQKIGEIPSDTLHARTYGWHARKTTATRTQLVGVERRHQELLGFSGRRATHDRGLSHPHAHDEPR